MKLAAEVGVPAAALFYTLYRVNVTLECLTSAVNKLTVEIAKKI